MALYVDIEPIVKRLTSVCLTDDCFGIGIQMGVNHALEIIAKAPIVEAEPVVHAHWIEDDPCCRRYCSACSFVVDDDASNFLYGNYQIKPKRCPECGAHMDENLEIRTAYCPICDKHFEIRSNESMGSCPDCGHDVVLWREGEE